MNHNVKLITITPDAEKTIAYIARVSNPSNQANDNIERLIAYCITHSHWSIFEHAHMTLEVNTTVAMSIQMLRHTSFKFQQFSQRYQDVSEITKAIPMFELRAQDTKNRQNSTETLSQEIIDKYTSRIENHFSRSLDLYKDMLADGIAKESARFVLPMATPTRMYITGNCRSWIHFLDVRTNRAGHEGTQKEHRLIAEEIGNIFDQQFPTVAKALALVNLTNEVL